ncbi:MAG TPA: glycosyltransferase family 1 protein, partial [Prolixibacteraceae bacterium]|nr:glycosyltransferase family 1 protein [Prolixibacteraceae bacterium]
QSDVPIIISKQSEIAEILTHAIKIDFWDINAMADAIYALVTYPALSREFKKQGRTEVDSLQWKNSAKNVRDVYMNTLNLINKKI